MRNVIVRLQNFTDGDTEEDNNLDIKNEETDYQIQETDNNEKKVTPPPHPLPEQNWDEPWLAIED